MFTFSLKYCKHISWNTILVFILSFFLSVFLYLCSSINQHLLQLFKFIYLNLVDWIAYILFAFYNFCLYLYNLLFTSFCLMCLINNPFQLVPKRDFICTSFLFVLLFKHIVTIIDFIQGLFVKMHKLSHIFTILYVNIYLFLIFNLPK